MQKQIIKRKPNLPASQIGRAKIFITKPIISVKDEAHHKIDFQVEEFLKRGGAIESVKQGITGHEDLHTDKTYNSH